MQTQTSNNPVNAAQTVWEHKLGLIPARIGHEFAHKLGIRMPMEEPRYGTTLSQKAPRVRTRIAPAKRFYEDGVNPVDGAPYAACALPGATVMLAVQDYSRLPLEDAEQVKWACKHPDCVNVRWGSKQELFEAHEDNRKLIAEAKGDARGPKAHVYLGVLEISGHNGHPAKLDDKGKVTTPAVAPSETIVMLVSDEV